MQLEDSATQLAHVVQNQLHLPLEASRAKLVGSDHEAVVQAAAALGDIGGSGSWEVRNLGV